MEKTWTLLVLLLLLEFSTSIHAGADEDPDFLVSWLGAIFGAAGILIPNYVVSHLLFGTLNCLTGHRPALEGFVNIIAENNGTFPHTVFWPPTHCPLCNSALTNNRPERRFKEPYLYSWALGPRTVRAYNKRCLKCKVVHYGNYFCVSTGKTGRQDSVRHLGQAYPPPRDTFVSTECTYFDAQLLTFVDSSIANTNGFTFRGFAHTYNDSFDRSFRAEERTNWIETLDSDNGRWLSYERLADGWFKWTLVNFLRESGVPVEHVDVGAVGADLDDMLLTYYPFYERAFEQEFGNHLCDTPGCNNTRVIDGHLKCRRFVCATRNVNFVPLKGFPNGGFFEGCKTKPQPMAPHVAGGGHKP